MNSNKPCFISPHMPQHSHSTNWNERTDLFATAYMIFDIYDIMIFVYVNIAGPRSDTSSYPGNLLFPTSLPITAHIHRLLNHVYVRFCFAEMIFI